MAIIQRPAKEGNATTYQDKVAQGFTEILAAEVDADFDAIYAAWNGGTDTVNIIDGSITGAKLAPGAVGSRELLDGGIQTIDLGNLQVTTGKLADGAVTLAKLDPAVKAAGGDLTGTYPSPHVASCSGGAFAFLNRGVIQANVSTFDMLANPSGWPGFDASKPSWLTRQNYAAGDDFEILRAPPGNNSAFAMLFSVNNAGKITAGAATRNYNQTITNTGFSTSVYDTPVLVKAYPAITTSGGPVLLIANHTLSYNQIASTGHSEVTMQFYRDGSLIAQHDQSIGGAVVAPVPPLIFLDSPVPAGSHTYDLRVLLHSVGATGSVTANGGPGPLVIVEIG